MPVTEAFAPSAVFALALDKSLIVLLEIVQVAADDT
jgi:hypothetical protein